MGEEISSIMLSGTDDHDSRLHISEDEYNLGALVIDDINDLVYRLVAVSIHLPLDTKFSVDGPLFNST